MTLDIAFTVATKFLARASSLLVLILLGKYLDAEQLGSYAIVFMSSFTFLYVLSLGFRQGIAFLLGREDLLLERALLYLMLFYLSFLPVSICISYFYYAAVISDLAVIGFAVLVLQCMLLSYILQGILIGRGDIAGFNKSELISKNAFLIFVAFLVIAGNVSVDLVLLSMAGSYVFVVLYIILRIWSDVSFVKAKNLSLSFKSGDFKSIIKNGLPMSLSMGVLSLVGTFSSYFIEERFGLAEVAIFFVAYKFSMIFVEVSTSIGLVVYSKVLRGSGLNSLLNSFKLAWLTLFMMLVLVPALFYNSEVVMGFLWGEKGIAASPILNALMFGIPFFCYFKVLSGAISANGQSLYIFLINVVSVLFYIVFCFLTVDEYGMDSVVAAFVISRLLSFCLILTLYFYISKRNFRSLV